MNMFVLGHVVVLVVITAQVSSAPQDSSATDADWCAHIDSEEGCLDPKIKNDCNNLCSKDPHWCSFVDASTKCSTLKVELECQQLCKGVAAAPPLPSGPPTPTPPGQECVSHSDCLEYHECHNGSCEISSALTLVR
ncbi:unnamed protein product [Meganyctiphanes norvegica]|uniref:Uncharacterized protein n=1 Tax=Meganyctiphanes norvegica TaxID=48144 RepID=A0AAV2PVU3_MEGNR